MLSVEVQEDMREAVNNLVKHFHKPEQEVRVRARVCMCVHVCVSNRDPCYIHLTCWLTKLKG